jgi:hypothetical protein
MNDDQKKQMREKLESLGIPFHEIKVFGAVLCNIHVKCESIEAAAKWALAISHILCGAKITSTKTVWPAVNNKFTATKPTMRQGFLVAARSQ